jgi:hypothetical protein
MRPLFVTIMTSIVGCSSYHACYGIEQEFVCIRVYELLRGEKGSREAITSEAQHLRESLIKAENDLERALRERDMAVAGKRRRESELLEDVKLLEETRIKQLEALSARNREVKEMEEKVASYDAVCNRHPPSFAVLD